MSKIKIYALGGLGEIGKNMYCIESNDEIVIIDVGVKFPTKDDLGIDYIIPNFNHLIKNKHKLKALVITHGHEDHIGGVPFFLKQLDIPVLYASPLAMNLIKHKIKDKRVKTNVKMVEYNEESTFQTKDFKIEFFKLIHSIPESHAIVIESAQGRIIYTGDFKIELNNPNEKINFHKITEYQNKGVDLLLSDSTNSLLIDQITISEKNIAKNIENHIRKAKGRVFISTFASNVNRVNKIIEMAYKYDRKILALGRSMEKNIEISKRLKYINVPEKQFISKDKINNFKDEELLIIATGSQGEELAAINRIAKNENAKIRFKPEDTVILSSSPIPGNNGEVAKMLNHITKSEVHLITHSEQNKIHSTGHGSSYELQLILSLLKPKNFMPVHGELRMLQTHKKLAVEVGINEDNVFVCNLGDVINLENKQIVKAGTVEHGIAYVDGNIIKNASQELIKIRENLAKYGILIIIVNVYSKKVINVSVMSKGYIFVKNERDLIDKIKKNIKEQLQIDLNNEKQNKEAVSYITKSVLDSEKRLATQIIPIIHNVKA